MVVMEGSTSSVIGDNLDYKTLVSFLNKEVFSVIGPCDLDKLGGDISLRGASEKFNYVKTFNNYSSGSRLDIVVSHLDRPNALVGKLNPSGLKFQFSYRNFIVPANKIRLSSFLKNDSLPSLIQDVFENKNKLNFFTNPRNLANFLYSEYVDTFSKETFNTKNPHDKAYFLSISSSHVSELDLIPLIYVLRDVDALISASYRNVNEVSREDVGNSSIRTIFNNSFDRKPISKDFDKGLGKVLSQYING